MAVTNEVVWRYSDPTATEGDDQAQADPDDSLGEFMATNGPTTAVKSEVFRPTTGQEGIDGIVLYRCLFVVNTHSTDTASNVRVFVPSQDAGGATFAIGLDPEGVVDGDSSSAQAAVIADEETAPTGVSFSAPSTYATGLVVGDLEAGEAIAVWVRMTVPENASAVDEDGAVLDASWLSDG